MNQAHVSIIALARSLYDFLPEPETWTGRMQRRALVERAVVAQAKEPCPHCSGRGHQGRNVCATCGGKGKLAIDPMTYWDPQTGKARPKTEALGGEDAKPSPRSPSEERQAFASAMRRAGLSPSSGDPLSDLPPIDSEEYLLARLHLRDRIGSYRELEHSLADLRRRTLRVYRVFVRTYVYAQLTTPHVNGSGPDLAEALVFIEGRMLVYCQGPIRVPAWLLPEEQARARKASLQYGHSPRAQAERAERNREIMRLREEGKTLEQIAPIVGLAKSRVAEIIAAGEHVAVMRETAA
jgi:hypothetical protein